MTVSRLRFGRFVVPPSPRPVPDVHAHDAGLRSRARPHRAPHPLDAAAHVAPALGPDRLRRAAQGGVLPESRELQDPRAAQQVRADAGRGETPWRRLLVGRQPRTGRRPRRARAAGVRGRHPVGLRQGPPHNPGYRGNHRGRARGGQARRRRPVKKVVFMGMGEPAHNLDNVLEAIDILGTDAFIGHKNLVLSTVGDMRVFDRLPTLRVKPALALSLHTTKADLREHLLPKAPKISPQELMELAESYARLVKHPTQVQWTLLKGVNDGQDELDAILKLFKGKYAVLNLIPFNSLEGDDYQRPEGERIVEIVRYLHSRGVLTKVRNSAGQDIDGGCGQLRARAVELVNTSRL